MSLTRTLLTLTFLALTIFGLFYLTHAYQFDTDPDPLYENHHDQAPMGCDYERKVLKARAIVDVLSSQAAPEPVEGAGLIGPHTIYDDRFAWMRPFEFYECGQGQEF